jgi:hypothetical protein
VAASEAPNPDRQTWGRRCDLGCESWPDLLEFQTCVRCGSETTRFSNLRPLSVEEARKIAREIEFNAFYERRCAEKKIPSTGKLPEWYEKQLGPLDARLSRPYLLPKKSIRA